MVKFSILFLLFFCFKFSVLETVGRKVKVMKDTRYCNMTILCTIIVFARIGIFSDIFSIANCTVNFKNSDFSSLIFCFSIDFLHPFSLPEKN